MIKIQWVNYSTSPAYVVPDLGWLSFKTYYEENGNSPDQVEWLTPICDSAGPDADHLANLIIEKSPDIVAFSNYVWNVGLNHSVAKIIKKHLPNVKIVYGGPHIEHKYRKDFFEINLHVDLVCHVEAYGEIFFTDLLDQEVSGEYNPFEITYAVFPAEDRTQLESVNVFYKRKYKWPRKIYEKNKDYIDYLIKSKPQGQLYYLAETSRGCPFGCVFCEWGGGINSKVSFKPMEYVLEDIDFVLDNYKPIVIAFTDANFGIVERDVDIVKRITDRRKEHPQIREFYLYGQSKVNKKILFEIYEELAKANLIDELVKISIQDFDQGVLDNIDRTDVDWAGHRDYLKDLLIRYNFDHLTIKYEMIHGLPGTTLDNFYKSFEYVGSTNPHRYEWWLLPTSPAANPAYIDKYKIKTINNKSKWSHDETSYDFSKSTQLIHDPSYIEDTHIVVETSSYTRDEWVEMYLVTEMFSAMTSVGLAIAPIRYIENHRQDISLSENLKNLLRNILYGNNNLDDIQKEMIAELLSEFREKVHSNDTVDISRTSIPSVFPIKGDISIKAIWIFIFMMDIRAFYNNLNDWAVEFNDKLLLESIDWNAEFMMTLEYDPTVGKTITANRDWHSITFNNGTLEDYPVSYIIKDTKTYEGFNIVWHNYPIEVRLIKDFVKYCISSTDKLKTFQVFETQPIKLLNTSNK